MKETTKLDDKYFVVKQEDLDDALEETGTGYFRSLLLEIEKVRKKKGKEKIYPSYLVLNLDDEIDQNYLIGQLNYLPLDKNAKVSDIAIALVNAILKAKEKKHASNSDKMK